ncbi:hypothetical protein G6O69_35415 [Pseudenhygromyxa sp. WMMC2535]|uniref:hypothetical protein n=1 Tax=Pseudenhygromyxa sp. WMMC2535 TaxID=2712867 RepID=UPI0015519EF7|nr:hypothetical protein [Pseudenhygromyxa sp. WMMC2535]NVB43167.1 hypothetical protein [Pseudenhygromyxa sp. WMMC2535]
MRSSAHPLLTLVLAASSLVALLGFTDCGGEYVGCGDDVLGCGDNGPEFTPALDCRADEQSGDIEIVAGDGDGEGGFMALAEDAIPTVHYGSQGGMHIWTGIQLRNPNLDRRMHQLSFEAQTCEPSVEDCADEASWLSSDAVGGPRIMVVGEDELRETAEGWLELRDVLLLLPYDFHIGEDTRLRFVVTAEDTCGRTGERVYGE